MAAYSDVRSKHAQLAASTVDTVTLDGDYDQVEVVNRDGAAEIYFTVDGPPPTVAGDGTQVLPASISGVVVAAHADSDTVVRLISPGAPSYSVRGV